MQNQPFTTFRAIKQGRPIGRILSASTLALLLLCGMALESASQTMMPIPAAFSASTTNCTVLALHTNVNTTTIIPEWIEIQSGDIIAILGTRSSNGSTHYNSYAGTSGPFTSNILGYPVTLTRMVYRGNSYPVGAVSQQVGGSVCRTEMYYIPAITGPNDAGIPSIDSPVNFCAASTIRK